MSWNMNEVVEVRWKRDYRVYIQFDDGMAGELDLSAYAGRAGIFESLANVEYFKRMEIKGGTLAWPNGADIAPERLYALLGRVSRQESSIR